MLIISAIIVVFDEKNEKTREELELVKKQHGKEAYEKAKKQNPQYIEETIDQYTSKEIAKKIFKDEKYAEKITGRNGGCHRHRHGL